MLHRATHRTSDTGLQLPSTDPSRPSDKHSRARRIPRRLLARGILLLAFALAGFFWYWHQPTLPHITDGATCAAKLAQLGVPNGQGLLPGLTEEGSAAALSSRRQAAYTKMAADLPTHGVRLGGVITQGLKQSDLFRFLPDPPSSSSSSSQVNGGVQPVLRSLEVPVRAVVVPIPEAVSLLLHAKAREVLGALLSRGSVWWQDPGQFHSTIYHASNMLMPVPADPAAVAAEAAAIAAVAAATCPLQVVLERVVVTSTGVVVACWQVAVGGGEPAALRDALQSALPTAPPPAKQLVGERAMLHTTIARLLAPALRPASAAAGGEGGGPGGAQQSGEAGQVVPDRVLARELLQAAEALTAALCGLTATAETLWFVEEQDLLALALSGRMVRRSLPLACPAA